MDDTISRQAALLSLDDEITITGVENAYTVRNYIRRVKRKLESLPSAQPERKKGKWIFGDGTCKCSRCGESPLQFVEASGYDWVLVDEDYPMFFCPYCGADMRGAEDD